MFCQNLHAHSLYDDGKSTIREMVEASKAAGLLSVGISVHSPLTYPSDWSVKPERMEAYLQELREVRRAFEGQIDVFIGIEWDILTQGVDLSLFDYAIGSVHHMPVGEPPLCVDESAQTSLKILETYYANDADAMAEAYFAQYDAVAAQKHASIVGHIDLIRKFDERTPIFNPDSLRYQRAALQAMEKLVKADKIFEINTGAISRGIRTTPYPDGNLLCALREMGGKITISADAHHASAVACAYDQAQKLAASCGFRCLYALQRTAQGLRFLPQDVDA